MTIATHSPQEVGKNTFKTLAKNHQHNLDSDYTEKIEELAKKFRYENEKSYYWSDPQFSFFYETPLYKQASESQKLALNHLFWNLLYKITADSEIELTHYNLITAGTLLKMGSEYELIAKQLEHETEQERVHIRTFYRVNYQTQKKLFGKPKKSDFAREPLSKHTPNKLLSRCIDAVNRKILSQQGKYKSPYFLELAEKNIAFVTPTQGFFNGFQRITPLSMLQLLVQSWGSSPFLACNFYGIRYLANLNLKAYEHNVVRYYKKQQKREEVLPIPSAISYYHFLDEAFHTTTSLFIGRDLYRQVPSPSAYEKLIANIAFYLTQRENFSHLSTIVPNRFTSDRTLLPYAYQILQSPIFGFSREESLHWLEKCLCQEHDGLHHNLQLHHNLLNEYRHFASKLDYLWSVNREMRLMSGGGSIEKAYRKVGVAIEQNKKAFQKFAQSV
ncbi:MAG: hypothetical protein SAJ37_16475 [Oscillatoria sp. PMC 1068.18]|nr:hypothetical protein [Oscillatoria sp. PMC 1076.18]MEC4990328.1 hypothetical protein [Oscillatoria sp. PMC 1068.18]